MSGAAGWTPTDADAALGRLRLATVSQESLAAARAQDVAKAEGKHTRKLAAIEAEIAQLNADLEAYYWANPPADGRKSIQLSRGTIGARAAASPALQPADGWTWEKIEARVRRLFGAKKYFHRPKPAGLDKVKVKRELTAADLARCGLALDTSETFYIDLTR